LKLDEIMFNQVYCYLSGHHDFCVRCEPGEIYLRCIHCGKRSSGWAINNGSKAASKATAGANRDIASNKRPTRSTAPVAASV
jgi:hypothetical protein